MGGRNWKLPVYPKKPTWRFYRGRFRREEGMLEFGRFRTVEKGGYPEQTLGLYHGAKVEKERVLIKPKVNHWAIARRRPSIQWIQTPSKALGTDIHFNMSLEALKKIRQHKGLDGYLMSEDPKMINYSRAFLYKDQIRQVYEQERELDFRKREERIKEILASRTSQPAVTTEKSVQQDEQPPDASTSRT
uniref:Uncharacterized protein n=1 Tax=Rhodosorus marinus TaxID=101924 RepID=A0A7S3E713_9RHOD|mmetsp:Transcript_14073/g.56624  ORF Transcript_14073/g.56624 Transcript_14073/m.56624 type:complete len:189 (+) Transcript_14073:614-1180(+)